jgi:hypothetical protein
MPVIEIVFLARKVNVEQNKLIQFDTVWGLPAQGEESARELSSACRMSMLREQRRVSCLKCWFAGEVAFISEGPEKTTVIFKLEHQLPWILVDMKVS